MKNGNLWSKLTKFMVKISCKLKYGLAGSTQRGWSDPAELGFNLLRPKRDRVAGTEPKSLDASL